MNNIIQQALPSIFNFDFPIFDEAYRNVLETKIIKHFYFREIGFETVGLWQAMLDIKLNDIMPFYNQLYKSATLDFNPFYDVDLTRTFNRQNDQTTSHQSTTDASANTDLTTKDTSSTMSKDSSHSTSDENLMSNTEGSMDSTTTNTNTVTADNTSTHNTTATKDHTDAYSDTPQGALTGVETLTYLSNARQIKDNDTVSTTDTEKDMTEGSATSTVKASDKSTSSAQNSNMIQIESQGSVDIKADGTAKKIETNEATTNAQGNLKNLEQYTELVKGKQGTTSYSYLLKEYRETMLNIDMMILDELSELFMYLW